MESINQSGLRRDDAEITTERLYQLSIIELFELRKSTDGTAKEQVERVIDEYRKADIYSPLHGHSIFQLSSLVNKLKEAPLLFEMNVWGDENRSLVESLCGKPGSYLESSYRKLNKGDKNFYILGFLEKQHRDLSNFLLERLTLDEIKRLRLRDDELVTDSLANNSEPNLEQ